MVPSWSDLLAELIAIADDDGQGEQPSQQAREYLREHGLPWTVREDYLASVDEPHRTELRASAKRLRVAPSAPRQPAVPDTRKEPS